MTSRSAIVSYLKRAFSLISGIKLVSRKLFRLTELRDDQIPAISITNGPETCTRRNLNSHMVDASWVLDLVLYVKDMEDPQTILDSYVAEMRRALSLDHTFEGHAISSEVKDATPDRGIFDPFASCVVRVLIEYRYNEQTQGG